MYQTEFFLSCVIGWLEVEMKNEHGWFGSLISDFQCFHHEDLRSFLVETAVIPGLISILNFCKDFISFFYWSELKVGELKGCELWEGEEEQQQP